MKNNLNLYKFTIFESSYNRKTGTKFNHFGILCKNAKKAIKIATDFSKNFMVGGGELMKECENPLQNQYKNDSHKNIWWVSSFEKLSGIPTGAITIEDSGLANVGFDGCVLNENEPSPIRE